MPAYRHKGPHPSNIPASAGSLESFEPRKRKLDEGPFGASGAAQYDEDARAMPRRYKIAHALQNQLVQHVISRAPSPQPVVVDLGCGTANDGLEILSNSCAVYLGVDYSSPMLGRAEEKIAQRGFSARALLIRRDFRWLEAKEFLTCLEKAHFDSKIWCVMSALALHHYDLRQKRRVYQLAFDLLSKGGLLVLTDLYSYAIKQCARRALQHELSDIRKTISRLTATRGLAGRNTTVSEHHYREENRPEVLGDEVALLSEIGFRKVDLPYRRGQLGVIAAER